MQNNKKEKLGDLLLDQSRRIGDKWEALIHHRDFSFLMPIFVATVGLFFGLLTTQYKPAMNKYSFLGIGLMLINLFLIPGYIWWIIRHDLMELRDKNKFYFRLFEKYLKDEPLDENDNKKFDEEKEKSEKDKGEDCIFNSIIFLFIIGLSIFLISLYKQIFKALGIDFVINKI